MFQLLFFLAVFIVSIILLIIFLVPQWEKVTDMLNGIMDWATSLFQKKNSQGKTPAFKRAILTPLLRTRRSRRIYHFY